MEEDKTILQLNCHVSWDTLNTYRVSHIIMALNHDFRDLSDSSRMNHFGNCVKVIKKKLLVENARFYEYYVRILAFKLGNNPYDMGSSEQQIL